MDGVVLCNSHGHPPQLVDCVFVNGMAIPRNSSANGTKDTVALQQPYEFLPYVNIRELTPASQASVIGCVLLAVSLASAVGADSKRVDD